MTDPHPDDLALLGVDLADLGDDGRSGTLRAGPGPRPPRRGAVRRHGAGRVGAGDARGEPRVTCCGHRRSSSAHPGWARIDWTTEVLAEGRRSSQLLVRATCEGAVVLTAVGSAGIGKDDGLTGQFRQMPEALPPEEGTPWGSSARTPTRPCHPTAGRS